jgi:murein L,D-transpeptidase YafK
MKESSTDGRNPRVLRFQLFIIFLLLAAAGAILLAQPRPRPIASPEPIDCILIEKSQRTLTAFRHGAAVKQYRIALGQNPVGAKDREGDMKTPEGLYLIDAHKPDSDFHRALHLSYPSNADRARAANSGVDAGSDIEIHGLPNDADAATFPVEQDWTAGCIALTNDQIDELSPLAPDGITVEITP